MRYCVLSSGSKANCAAIEHDGHVLLIDCGLGPIVLRKRLEMVGLTWDQVESVVVTHTHCDHISEPSFRRLGVPVWCHADHRESITCEHVYEYDTESYFEPIPGFRVLPFHVWHDSPSTHGFRVTCGERSVGHVADTGSWTTRMAQHLAGVDVLGVEANHDVAMQLASDRPISLIERVLSQVGHLSNEQCLAFCTKMNELGPKPHDTVLLHLSHHCNTPELAAKVISQIATDPVVASIEEPTHWFTV